MTQGDLGRHKAPPSWQDTCLDKVLKQGLFCLLVKAAGSKEESWKNSGGSTTLHAPKFADDTKTTVSVLLKAAKGSH